MNALDRPVSVTFFPDFAAKSKTEEPCTPRALAFRIRAVTASRKQDLPWLKLARFGDRRTERNSLRHDANVLAVTGIEADYDGGSLTFGAAVAVLEKQGVVSVIYTSPSHTDGAPRWRVLCPLSAAMQPHRRGAMLGRLNGLFGGIFAGESWTLSQSYYYGSVSHNPSHRAEVIDGTPIDEHDDLDAVWQGKPGSVGTKSLDDRQATAGEEARGDAELVRRIVSGDGFHAELCALAGRYVGRGMTRTAAAEVLRGLMLCHPENARDDRWRDRYASIPTLVASAEAKFYSDASEGRRAIARLIAQMTKVRAPASEIRNAARDEAKRHGLPPNIADELAAWLARRERARRGVAHA